MAKFALTCCILTVIFLCEVNAYSKRWIWSTNWDDPKNWDKGRLPCSQDEIQLSEGVLYINKNLSVNSLTLPTNGELVFDASTEVTFSSGQKLKSDRQGCPASGENVQFVGNQPKQWLNPLNWNFLENGKVANWTSGSLYMDRIPCKTDQVSFPPGDAFAVSVKGNAEVSEIVISKKSLENVPAYLASKAGQLRFKVAAGSSLTVKRDTCNQPFGCSCGYANMKEVICSTFTCPPACENKVKPEGDCCERCGALIKMNLNPTFSLTSCQSILRNYLAASDFKAATLFISPILKDNAVERAQILLTDKTDGTVAVGAARATLSHLQAGEDSVCAVFNAKMETSTNGGNGGESGKSKGGEKESSTIALAVTLTLVFVLIILAAMYLLYRRKHGPIFNNKQVLHNEMEISGSHTLEMANTNFSGVITNYDDDIVEVPGKFGASFENPMYDEVVRPGPAVTDPVPEDAGLETITAKPIKKAKKKSDKSIFSKAKSKSDKKNSNDAFENPVYSEFAPDVEETFDPKYNIPVPGDTGFQNPLYGDLYTGGESGDVEEVPSKLPPSFLDTIGFTPEDMDDAVNAANDAAVVTITDADLGFGSGKGESEA